MDELVYMGVHAFERVDGTTVAICTHIANGCEHHTVGLHAHASVASPPSQELKDNSLASLWCNT